MHIAIFADVHGRILLCFKLCLRWQQETGTRLDLILQTGDLGVFPDPTRIDKATRRHAHADPDELGFANDFMHYRSDVAHILDQVTCPMLFVRGNHEDHEWLDVLERQHPTPIFPIDVYQRIFCLQSGVPYSYATDDAAIRLLGIGRIAASSRVRTTRHSSYIQPEESARLKQLQPTTLDVLLTHDSAKDSVTAGAGMLEIRTILDRHTPHYHFYGHTGEPYTQRRDSNGMTQTYKLADLVWEDHGGLPAGVMGILAWHDHTQHDFAVVTAPWLREYTQYTWRFIPS